MAEEVAVTMASPGAAGTTPADDPAGTVPQGSPAARPGQGPSGADPAGIDAAGTEPAVMTGPGRPNGGQAARPQLIRALNEQLLLSHIRQLGPCSRADLARLSGLSKPTVSLALVNVERSGLVRIAGQRTGVPGRSARLYEVRPDAGFVLGLDIGLQYLRGALADLTGEIRAKTSARARASSMTGRVAELIRLADALCAEAGVNRPAVTQTVIGSPGVYDPRRNAMALTGQLAGWSRPAVLAGLREAFGQDLVVENDVDAAALAEQAHGHGREFASFAFVWIGTGIGMGFVVGHEQELVCRGETVLSAM
jgi:DNA-binding transcriptional ArsR family regulator